MMKQKQKWLSGVALVSLLFLFTGCGEQPQEPVEPIQQTQQSDAGGGETGPSQQQPVEETSPTDTAPQGESFVAAESGVQLFLPAEGDWEKETESPDLISFTDAENGFLDIICLSGEEADSTAIPTSEDAFNGTMQDDPSIGSYEVEFFGYYETDGGAQGYRAVVKYLENESFQYSVTNALNQNGKAYIVNASLTTDDETVLTAVENAVNSLQILE